MDPRAAPLWVENGWWEQQGEVRAAAKVEGRGRGRAGNNENEEASRICWGQNQQESCTEQWRRAPD